MIEVVNVYKRNIELADSENLLSYIEKRLLIELICNEQTHMIMKDHTKYISDKYKKLEGLKIKIKDL